MATDPSTGNHPADPTELPLQPTGSVVADTEIARMAAEFADHDPDAHKVAADDREGDEGASLSRD